MAKMKKDSEIVKHEKDYFHIKISVAKRIIYYLILYGISIYWIFETFRFIRKVLDVDSNLVNPGSLLLLAIGVCLILLFPIYIMEKSYE